MIPRRGLGLVALAVVTFIAGPTVAQDFPRFTAPVVDAADVVPADVEERVNAALNDYQRRSGNQIAVAVVETTGRMSLEDYSIDLARRWGIGRKGNDDGALLLIAYDDRRLRVEVGRGLEGELTDLESGRIIREHVVPLMRQDDIGRAIEVGTSEIRRALGDTELGPPPQAVEAPEDDSAPGWAAFLPVFFLIPFLAMRGRRRRRWGWATPVFWGGGWGGLGQSGGSSSRGFDAGGGFGGGGGGGFGGGGASGGW